MLQQRHFHWIRLVTLVATVWIFAVVDQRHMPIEHVFISIRDRFEHLVAHNTGAFQFVYDAGGVFLHVIISSFFFHETSVAVIADVWLSFSGWHMRRLSYASPNPVYSEKICCIRSKRMVSHRREFSHSRPHSGCEFSNVYGISYAGRDVSAEEMTSRTCHI